MLARAAAWLDRAAFNPSSLPDDVVSGIALVAPVAAGLIIFKSPALQMLAIALAFGIGAQLLARWLWRKDIPRSQASPLIAAVFGIALVGAGASLTISIEIAFLAVTLELLRARFIPAIRAQPGLLAFAAIVIIFRTAPRGPLPGLTVGANCTISTGAVVFALAVWPERLIASAMNAPSRNQEYR